ncbi:MAG: hypothetical protein LM550_06390 [Candidatus Contendobacter sp.]|nr:hypothetical protein [Gammaproteobacteria bacterium]MCC8993307.1 hypothetical protein [Candidatus Contendobacter sp.]
MKFFRTLSAALVLSLGAMLAHAQGWQNESFPAGPGKPELKYHLQVPTGVTVTNKQGAVFKGGDIVTIPGKNVTVLESAYAKEQMKDPAFQSSFINEQQYMGMPEEKVRDYAIVSIQVSEGVTIQSAGGKTIKGPSKVTLMVVNKGSATPDKTAAPKWESTGGWDNE